MDATLRSALRGADDTALLSALLRAGRLTEPQKLTLAFLRHPVAQGLGPQGAERPESWARGLCRQAGAYHLMIMAAAKAQRLWQAEDPWNDEGLLAMIEEYVKADDLEDAASKTAAAHIALRAAMTVRGWRRTRPGWQRSEAIYQAQAGWARHSWPVHDETTVDFSPEPLSYVHTFVTACGLGNPEPLARRGFKRWRPQIEEHLLAWVTKQIRSVNT